MTETPLEITNLVKHYFNICNTALTRCADRILCATVLKLVDDLTGGEVVTLRVVQTRSGAEARFTTQFVNGQFTPPAEGEHDPDACFELSEEFLRDVVDRADHYIEHPERLDWSWLGGRV